MGDEFAQWKRETKDGYLLRILKYLGAYDGRNGYALSFKRGALQVPFDDVSRLERVVRG